jgi:hypothetical protein
MSKRIVREREGRTALACGKTKFREQYVLRDPSDPYVPDTTTRIKRLRPIKLGARNVGFLSTELEALIDALAAQRDAPSKKRVAS